MLFTQANKFQLKAPKVIRFVCERTDAERENVTRLIIRPVGHRHQGRYQCVASNQEGTTRSNELIVTVLCKPIIPLRPHNNSNTPPPRRRPQMPDKWDQVGESVLGDHERAGASGVQRGCEASGQPILLVAEQ